jgi:hypothetical protein
MHSRIPDALFPTDRPYYGLGDFYKSRFGERVQKIPVTLADDCPNRRGLKGMQVCVFCDEWGSAAYPKQRELDLSEQIRLKIRDLGNKYDCAAFIIYFQAYTNTFLAVPRLRAAFETAIATRGVKGIAIGTRPDCLSKAVLDLWSSIADRAFVSVELGIQSLFDAQLEFLRRGHSAQACTEAIERIKAHDPRLDLCVHLMFGLPGETDDQIIETARRLSQLPIDHVKLHNLHVLRNTPLEAMYQDGSFTPIELDAYADRVALFLQHLSPRISIHRLNALCSRWDELIAPQWTRYKLSTTHFIVERMRSKNAWQGQFASLTSQV